MKLFDAMRADTPCNLCHSTQGWLIGEKGRHGQRLRTLLCQECGLAWTDPTPSKEELEKFYVDDYRELYKGTFEPKSKHTYRAGRLALKRWNRLAPYLPPGGRLLDIGSGGGEFLYLMREQGYEVAGIEPNRGYGEYAQRTLDLPITVSFIGDHLPVDGEFQVVTMFHVLEHLRDPLAMIRMVAERIGKNGVLIIEVPNLLSILHAPNQPYHYAHLFHFSPKTLTLLGALCGMRPAWCEATEEGDNVTIVLKRDPTVSASLPAENGPQIRTLLAQHTAVKHYLRPFTYRRFIAKQCGQLAERVRVARYANQRDALLAAITSS